MQDKRGSLMTLKRLINKIKHKTNKAMGARSGSGAGMGSGNSGLENAMRARMKEIQNSNKEHVSIFDTKGNELFRAVGNEYSVAFDEDLAANRITVHNHPGDSTFSYEDIESAVKNNLSEMRVIARSGDVYTLKRPKKGWGVKASKLNDIVGDIGWKVGEKIGKMDKEVSMNDAFHMQWQAVAKHFGWGYSKTKIS